MEILGEFVTPEIFISELTELIRNYEKRVAQLTPNQQNFIETARGVRINSDVMYDLYTALTVLSSLPRGINDDEGSYPTNFLSDALSDPDYRGELGLERLFDELSLH